MRPPDRARSASSVTVRMFVLTRRGGTSHIRDFAAQNSMSDHLKRGDTVRIANTAAAREVFSPHEKRDILEYHPFHRMRKSKNS